MKSDLSDDSFCSISINRREGEFSIYPNLSYFGKDVHVNLESHEVEVKKEKQIHHFTWHKDGKIHVKLSI
jgi:hypothetical protein